LRQRCGDAIYGADHETLESHIFQKLALHGWKMAAFECNLESLLQTRLSDNGLPPEWVQIENGACPLEGLIEPVQNLATRLGVDVVLGASFQPGDEKQSLAIAVITPAGLVEHQRTYGGPPLLGVAWAVQTALDYLRRIL
jgi:hypothetical protein